MKTRITLALFILILPTSMRAWGDDYVAYSLREAQARLTSGTNANEVAKFGGITKLTGMVLDPDSKDLILIGVRSATDTPLELDDLVVGLRSRLVKHQWPLVSLDNTPDTSKTHMEHVRFEGGIANTQLGKSLLDADLTLKDLALGTRSVSVWGVKSYASLCDEAARKGDSSRASVLFWFFPMNYAATECDRVYFLNTLSVGTKTQLLTPTTGSAAGYAEKDPMGDQFANDMTAAYSDLSVQFPKLRRVNQVFSIVAIAYAIENIKDGPDLTYLLQKYQIQNVPTPDELPCRTAPGAMIQLTGGVQMRALLIKLRDGDVGVLRDVVLKSRPDAHVVSWRLPLSSWQISGGVPANADQVERDKAELDKDFAPIGTSIIREPAYQLSQQPVVWKKPSYETLNSLSELRPLSVTHVENWMPPSHVGGVMLSNTASVAGGNQQVNIADGNFSLVVDGQNATLSPETYGKFVTAMWAVYYCKDPPGISIDPIARGADKQMVRYIGQVVNTDLGRVMREADYTMKKWAIGTETPVIPGFEDVDVLSVKNGLNLIGASRRFWFVPEEIRFKRGGDMLVFDSGHMRLKTEYIVKEGKQQEAEPADLAFAKFFTDHYGQIAAKYGIYDDLFEYAKMVALARYLKESGVPLQWFLLANRDLVLTEDSPGTVDTLAKGSRFIEGMTIEGGVDMGIQGKYVFDQEAMNAIAKATVNAPRSDAGHPNAADKPKIENIQPLAVNQPVSYSLVPQHSLTSGRDRRGLRYQTDIALRNDGEPGLEMVRFFDGYNMSGGEFGDGWRLLVPYRIHPADANRRNFKNVSIPVRMAAQNVMSGSEEILDFDEKRYGIVGYVPKDIATSQVVGVFPLTDATFRLADKLGNEMQFDEAGYLTDLLLGQQYQIHYEWTRGVTDAIARPGIRIQPNGAAVARVGNNLVPASISLVDAAGSVSEPLELSSDENGTVGYLPAKDHRDASHIRIIAVRNDGQYELLNKDGQEALFAPEGVLAQVTIPPDSPMPRSIGCGDEKSAFRYTVDVTGRIRIGDAKVSWPKQSGVYWIRYGYDEFGNLTTVNRAVEHRTIAP